MAVPGAGLDNALSRLFGFAAYAAPPFLGLAEPEPQEQASRAGHSSTGCTKATGCLGESTTTRVARPRDDVAAGNHCRSSRGGAARASRRVECSVELISSLTS